jgi:hypothetical protein
MCIDNFRTFRYDFVFTFERCTLGYITLRTLAKLLGIPADMIEVAHERGYLPEPARVKGLRAFDLAEVITVARYFGIELGQSSHNRRSRDGTPSQRYGESWSSCPGPSRTGDGL